MRDRKYFINVNYIDDNLCVKAKKITKIDDLKILLLKLRNGNILLELEERKELSNG